MVGEEKIMYSKKKFSGRKEKDNRVKIVQFSGNFR